MSPIVRKFIRAIHNRGFGNVVVHSARRIAARSGLTLLGPDVIRISPINCLCNFRCPMCWIQNLTPEEYAWQKSRDKENVLTLSDYEALFRSISFGLREVNVVGGGEPLIHPDIVDIFRVIKRRKLIGSLISNGALLNETVAREMIEMCWNVTRISVNAGDAATFKAVNGVDVFCKVVNNLKIFNKIRHESGVEKQVKLVVFHVIQKENLESIDKLFQVAETTGADFIEFDLVMPFSPKFALSADEMTRASAAISKHSELSPIPCNSDEILSQLMLAENTEKLDKPFVPARFCSVGFDQTFITSDGEVLPCCFSSEVMGNLHKTSFDKIWFSEKYTKFRKRLMKGRFAEYCVKYRCALPGVLHH